MEVRNLNQFWAPQLLHAGRTLTVQFQISLSPYSHTVLVHRLHDLPYGL
jgi:hypothetical protein